MRADARAQIGRRKRGDRQDRLAGHAQRLTTRDHEAHARAGADERLGQLRTLAENRIAVVEDEQQPLAPQVVDDRGQQRPSGRLGQPEGADHRREHEVGGGEAAALDDPGAVLELVEQRPGEPEPDPGLADPAGPGQRQERGSPEDLGRLLDLALAADEARDLEVEVVPRRLRGSRRREVAGQARAADLEQALRQVERPEPVHAEVDEADLPRSSLPIRSWVVCEIRICPP